MHKPSQTEQKSATFSLLDHTNDLTTVSDFDSLYQFDHLLPGNYTLRLLSEDMATDWINNTLDIQLTNNFEPENITISHGKRIEGSVLLAGVPEGDASVASPSGKSQSDARTARGGVQNRW